MQTQKIVWPAVFLTALFGMGALSLWGVSTIMGITAIPMMFAKKPEAITSMIIAVSSGFLGLVLLTAAVIALLKIMGRKTAEQNTRLPFVMWHIPVALFIAVSSIGVGSLLTSQPYLSVIFLPILTLSGVLAPLWIIMSIGTRRMELGPRWRAWGIFGLGMTLGPILMMFLEITVGIVLLIGVIIYFVMQPELANQMVQFSTQLQTTSDPEQALNLFAPYLLKPAVLALVLTYTSLAIPMIEELFKPIGVWLFVRQIKTPMAGFAMGILSGTAYALVENLGMTAQAGAGWPAIVIARAGAGLLHVANTGLMGWAIASLVNEKKIARFFLTYIATVTFHGLWNSASIGFAIYAIAQELDKNYPWAITLSAVTLTILIVVFPAILIVSNRKLNASNAAESAAPAPSP
ncbi:MAG: PrsW family intramembrane metalloprotease [Anaerolineales bacterium]|nr:PrsW family intramembrane metalloprotease [Anaerolineales bacterium]